MNTFEKLQETLMRELRLMHAPVAIKYFFDQDKLDSFKKDQPHYSPIKPLTFCQSEVGARMEGITVLVERENLGCTNASFVFGWKDMDESEVKSHLKYCADADHARQVAHAWKGAPTVADVLITRGPALGAHIESEETH